MSARRRRPLATLALITMMGAGCGGGSEETGSPVTGSSRADGTGATRSVRFADCMREHSVTAFPDPGAPGGDQAFLTALKSLDQGSPAWKTAIRACRDLRPPGLLGGRANPEQTSARLKFAKCMRENGVKDFPDPVDGQPLVDTRRIPSAVRDGVAAVDAAMRKCRGAGAEALGER